MVGQQLDLIHTMVRLKIGWLDRRRVMDGRQVGFGRLFKVVLGKFYGRKVGFGRFLKVFLGRFHWRQVGFGRFLKVSFGRFHGR